MIVGSVAKNSFMPEIGFECHDLGDGRTGDLPASYVTARRPSRFFRPAL
jgi:hypothetical protein